jgi:hypothetical protein
MFHNLPRDIRLIFDTVLDQLIPPPPGQLPELDRETRKQRALNRIEYILRNSFNYTCEQIGLETPSNYVHEDMIEEEEHMNDPTNIVDDPARQGEWRATVDRHLRLMTPAQRRIYDLIMKSVKAVRANPLNTEACRCYMTEGPGGVGKTLLNSTIIAECKNSNLRVLPTASTGIASILLPGGATAHSTFWIPPDVDHETQPRLDAHGPMARRLRNIDLIIIDEVSMFDRVNFDYIDRQLRDLFPRDGRGRLPFGGIPILITGNWAQLPPVVVGGDDGARREASIKMSPLFRDNFTTFYLRENKRAGAGEVEFANWLLQVGYGRNFINNTDCIDIPEQARCESLNDMIEFCYPAEAMRNPIVNIDLIKNNCILAPLRKTVARINDRIRDMIPHGRTETLHAFDHRVADPDADDPLAINRAEGDIEYIHSRTPSGLPPYELKLKKGMICIMICNYDPQAGLYNGTRVQIIDIQRNFLKVKILTGNMRNASQEILISRKKFEYGRKRSEPGIPFTRIQYPLEPGFALTISKAQGQTLCRVGIDIISRQCFSHGMLYTALSRVSSLSALRIMSGLIDKAVNIVDRALIQGADVDNNIDPGPDPDPSRDRDEPMDQT